MSKRAEILFLAHRIPYPPDKGDKIRSWRLLNKLAEHFRIHLAAFVDDPEDFAHEARLQDICETVFLEPLHPLRARIKSAAGLLSGGPLSFAYFRSNAMARHVAMIRERDLALEFVFSSSMAPYIADSRRQRPRFVDFCDADSQKWRDYAKARRGPMRWIYSREADTLAAAEAEIMGWADVAFAVSEAEAKLLGARPAAREIRVLANGVDTDYFSPAPESSRTERGADVVFVGAMDYATNVDAALWFAKEVWPRVRASAPAATFAIVGPRPSTAIRNLSGSDGIVIAGRVDDVRPWLQRARAVVAPLRIARGVPNKVIEAMAIARPVVATSAANVGIGAAPGSEVLIADDPRAFAQAVVGLLGDATRGDKIGAAARVRVRADFQWPAQLEKLDVALRDLGLL
ncbi:MAG: TIGR03087 family PEP-CTERM/XrtA system glycosyltransferase [Parvularculaceae bacterium]